MKKHVTISEASKIVGVNKETLRRWDKTGRFKSSRNPVNNYRIYPIDKLHKMVRDLQLDIYVPEIDEVKKSKSLFYKTENGKLFNTDVIDFFQSIESESVDMIFADPPYNIKKAEWDTFQSQKQYVDWSMKWIREAYRVLKQTGTLYICGFSEILADIKWSANYLFKGCKWLIWYYRNKANLGTDWGRSHESLLHFRKSRDFIFNIDEVRIPYNEHTLKYPVHPQAESSQYSNGNGKKYIWRPHPNGAKPKDVFEIPTLSNSSWERTSHETQKPIELVKKCVLSSSNAGSLVVDPFGGSGTTYAVCEAFNRRWLGAEINRIYCDIIRDRINDSKHISRIASGKDELEARQRREKLRRQ